MRIAVTGRHGQVARALNEIAGRHGHEVVLLGRPDLDLADPSTVAPAIRAANARAVINAAAYTAVDKAESEPDVAEAVNGAGAGAVAVAAAELGLPVLQVSTDYVFDGSKPTPYVEEDTTGPLGAYGHSKLAGERAVAEANPRHAILRTAWVYAPYGANFVRTMLRIAGNKPEVNVVADQHGCPTSALDIATTLLGVAARMADAPRIATSRACFTWRRGARRSGPRWPRRSSRRRAPGAARARPSIASPPPSSPHRRDAPPTRGSIVRSSSGSTASRCRTGAVRWSARCRASSTTRRPLAEGSHGDECSDLRGFHRLGQAR